MSKAKLRKWRRSPRGRPTAQGQQFETRRRRSHRRPAPAESTTAWHTWSLDGRRCWPRSRRETPYSPRLAFATRRPFRTTRGGARGLILCVNRRPPRAVARLTVSCRQRVSQPRPRRPPCIFCWRGIVLRSRRGVFFYKSACGRGASGHAGKFCYNISCDSARIAARRGPVERRRRGSL